MKYYQLLLQVLFFIAFTSSFAEARKITIIGDGMIKLVNPTNATVNFTISCKDKSGATSIAASNESLLAGKSKVFGVQTSASQCIPSHNGNMVSPATAGYLNGMVKCYKTAAMYIDVNQAGQLCASGYRMCSLQEYATNKGSGADRRGVVASPTFSTTMDTGTTWTNRSSGSNEYPYIDEPYGMSNYQCATGTSGTGTVVSNCEFKSGSMTTESAFCCPDTVVDQCSVEITSTTGHLQSPQFKGGAPF